MHMPREHGCNGTPSNAKDIPVDILIKILSYAKGDGIDLAQPHTYPTIHSRVCKEWQTTVLSTPELWSNIIIKLPPNESTHSAANTSSHFLSALQMYLERSRSLPLSLSFIVPIHCLDQYSPSVPPILDLCLGHSSRWRDIVFDFPIDHYIPAFLPARHYPLLREFSLRGTTNTFKEWTMHDHDKLVFKNTPLLKTLHFNHFPIRLHDLGFLWAEITKFSAIVSDNGQNVDPSLGQKIVSQMPKLRSLKLTAIAEAQ